MTAIHDTLRLSKRWQAAGIPEDQADKMVQALNEEIEEGVATKVDLALAVRDLKIWTGGVAVALFAALAAIRYFG